MKYLILFAVLSMPVFAQNCVPTVTSGEYKIKTGGEILINPCGGKPCMNQKDAKSIQDQFLKSNGKRVDVIQPNLIGTCAVNSSSKLMSSSSSSVSSQVTLSWSAPAQYTDNQTLSPERICGYSLKLGAKPEFQVKATGDKMSWISDAPKDNETFQIATVEMQDDCTNYSAYVPFINR